MTFWNRHRTERRSPALAAFSLLELLIVMGIMVTLVALATPAITSTLESGNLARGGQAIGDEINLARQIASTQNQVLELRIFKHESLPGYGSVQIWASNLAGTSVPLMRVVKLPQNIVVAENAALSKALSKMTIGTMPAGSSMPGRAYASFRIRPSGAVDPSVSMNDFYFAVVSARFATQDKLPRNYVTIQINPLTGTPLVYRP